MDSWNHIVIAIYIAYASGNIAFEIKRPKAEERGSHQDFSILYDLIPCNIH